jgi:gliding motility-associated-like protein
MFKKAALTVLLLLTRYMVFADVFVVTSNADSGPGTFRQALISAAANDSTQTDYIHFNLPDITEVGRTITITSQLPDVSSNLVIDGSTQPGSKLGRSNAKVELVFEIVPVAKFCGLKIVGKHDVSVYGLYLNFSVSLANTPSYLYSYSGIQLIKDKNIQIGAAGKGNVIKGFYVPIWSDPAYPANWPIENLTIKDNFFGVAPNGETLSTNPLGALDFDYVTGNIVIGGAVNEGNLIIQSVMFELGNSGELTDPYNFSGIPPAYFTIKNNIIGTDINQQKTIGTGSSIDISSYLPTSNNTITIEDNVIATKDGPNIYIRGVSNPVTILRNYINTNKAFTSNMSMSSIGISIADCPKAFIGSTNLSDANYITKCKPLALEFGAKVAVHKNSFYCGNTQSPMYFHGSSPKPAYAPDVQILTANSNLITGSATPNALVELFYSDICGTCSPQTYFTSVTAGTDGKWQYSGLLTGAVIASATLNSITSEFTRVRIQVGLLKVNDACDGLGSITGANIANAQSVKWLNEAGDVVSTTADLLGVPTGKYKLVVSNGMCSDETPYYIISKGGVNLNGANARIKNTSCGRSDGAITGITSNTTGFEIFSWTNATGAVVGNNRDLTGVPAGTYTLNASVFGKQCYETYGPAVIANTTGPAINQTNASIQSTNCGQATGSITGITATGTGTLKYTWKNAAQQIVATTADLTNEPAGQYRLEVTDETLCGPVYTTVLTIPETNGITLNDANVIITPSSCNTDNGSVKGIVVTGATSYKWLSTGNVTVATTADLLNSSAGTYTFTASNAFGCIQTKTYTIGLQVSTQYPLYTVSITAACSGTSNGGITVAVDNKVAAMRWVNNQNATIGTASSLNNLAAGSYRFYVSDANGCETLYKMYDVEAVPPIVITPNSALIINDVCGTKTGSIKGIKATGGTGSYSFEWTDSNNNNIAATADVANLAAGSYNLRVYNTNNCNQGRATFTVLNDASLPTAPVAADVEICSAGQAIITVASPDAGYQYKLYDTPISSTPVNTQMNGKFTVNVSSARDYYISRAFGTCESPRVKVHISLSVSALNIPNTLTPNGDGINDLWLIPGLQNNTTTLVQVFNRSGTKVFESKGYAAPFDGKSNGKALPIGTYYYIINPGQGCKLFTGTLTVIR